MRFIDQVRVIVRAGRGGDGAVAWRREKYVPKGGPAGGDGGRGGDIIFEADPHLSTLLDLHYRRIVKAESGQPGGRRDCNGRGGEDLVIKVPVGTVVYLEGKADEDPLPPVEHDDEGMQNVYLVPDRGGMARLEQARADLAAEAAGRAKVIVGPTSAAGSFDTAARHVTVTADEGEGDDQADASSSSDDDDAEGPADAWDDDEELDEEAMLAALQAAEEAGELDEAFDDDDEDDDPGELIGDLSSPHQRLIVARGGQGGRGNIHFRSSTNQAPDHAEPGTEGEAWRLRLELKLLADVGIVGFPNVGKSTFIRKVSRARPKVGAYPFTTLVPNLGVVSLSGGRSMVVADVPGLIRGASDGKGLGLQFLRHLERTRVLLHVLAPDYEPGREPVADLEALEQELERYGSQFDGRPRVVALNKLDLLSDEEGRAMVARVRATLRERNIPLFTISAQTGAGIPRLLEAIWRRLHPGSASATAPGGDNGDA